MELLTIDKVFLVGLLFLSLIFVINEFIGIFLMFTWMIITATIRGYILYEKEAK